MFVDDRPAEPHWASHFVGLVDGQAWWAVDVPEGDDDPSYGAAMDLRAYHGRAPEPHWLAAGRAVQIVEWARTHRYCGRCGTPTVLSSNERSMQCPACALVAFPRLSPAMITLVTRGPAGPDQEALLARGVQWTIPMYSCLAGFVEPGESLEAAVHREVEEEVGLQSLGLRTSFHENFDLHIHVPEGATPKDGPSAGVGMCTALVSALTAIPVRFDVAMTGEITLRGQVLKIGGLKEKLLAAHRGNIKTVIIPADNERDLIEIPDNIKADLEIVPVRWIDQVLEHALQYQPTPLSSDENQKQEKEAKQEDIDKIGDKKHINTH